jgi:hypothetical protein
MTPEMPTDPFGAPEDLVNVMKGLAQLHAAALMANFSEKVATDFISNVFVQLINAQQQAAT